MMRMRERLYFLITLLLSLAAMIVSSLLWIGHYDAEKKLFADTPLVTVLAVLLTIGAVFCLSGLFALKGVPLRRLPKPKGGIFLFGALTGLFILAAFVLNLIYGSAGASSAAQNLSGKVVSVGTAVCALLGAAYFVYVSFARRPHHAAAGWLGLGAMLWCMFTAVGLYFDMSYALASPVRLLNMMAALSMLLYVTGEVRYFLAYPRIHQYETFAYLFILFGFAYSVPKAITDFTKGAPSAETVLALAQCSAVMYTVCRLFSLLKAKPIKMNPKQKKETMMEYTFKRYEYLADVDWNQVDKAMIDKFGWGYTDYKPLCYAQGVYTDDAGMVIKLTAFEQNPRATKTEFMDSVCNDSCLEFFFSADRVSYTNFEFNALGTQHTSVGAPGARGPIDQFTERPVIKAEQLNDRWEITFALSHKMVKDITGKELARGAQFYGNFYKCGDECEHKHYGMWNEVKTETPSFHQPDYFGVLHIG
ncbi:MAG: hypothetical protein HFE78_00620 [Clostridiales bacterium]|nr:hypothetical protein [Clostridiales bacterium]